MGHSLEAYSRYPFVLTPLRGLSTVYQAPTPEIEYLARNTTPETGSLNPIH